VAAGLSVAGQDRYALALEALEHDHTRLQRAPDDRYVRLTRCQWSARKKRPADRYTTLHAWLTAMKQSAPDAWRTACEAGLRVDGRGVRFKGKPANGNRLARVVPDLLASEAVAAFEREQARRALERFERLVVTPGRWGRYLLGCGFEGAEMRLGKLRVALEPPEEVCTVADAFPEGAGLASAARAALSAPDVMVAAVWRLTGANPHARPRAKDALSEIGMRVRTAVRKREVGPRDAPWTGEELTRLGVGEAYETLRGLAWPAPQAVDTEALARSVEQSRELRRSPVAPVTSWSLAHG